MARLSLSLLGSFRVDLDGQPATEFESDKVRALLAYLAVESDRPHRRETLAGLLWPERPESNARQNLSQTLFKLRRAIRDREAAPPFLLISASAIQFNPESDHRTDVRAFSEPISACENHRHARLEVCDSCMDRLRRALAAYNGGFLEGFSLAHFPGVRGMGLAQP